MNEELFCTMEKWGTYRESDASLKVFNTQKNEFEILRSFSLKNVPPADALLVFDAYPRVAEDGFLIAVVHQQNYGRLPEFLTCGGYSNKGLPFDGKTQAEWFEYMFIQFGAPETWVMRNHHQSQSTNNKMNIQEIREMIKNSDVLSKCPRPRILVVTGCGYSLRAAQELGLALTECELVFYETPVTPLNVRLFDYERFDTDGLAIDIILASVLHPRRFWHQERLPLPEKKMAEAPSLEIIREWLLKGYALYYPYRDMWEYVGIPAEQGLKLYEQRRRQITGFALDGTMISDKAKINPEDVKARQIDVFVRQVRSRLQELGIFMN